MAASTKRAREEDDTCESLPKKSHNVDEKLQNFMEWCKENNFNVSPKVTVARNGSCAQYGMIALEDITEGYCLFQVPRSCILMHQNTDISHLVEKDADRLAATNQWVPLLVTLIHEQKKTLSKWRPYLDLVPDYSELDLPIFWNSQDIEKYLKNSIVDSSVTRDLETMKDDFNKLVLPFFQRHHYIKEDVKDFEHFKRQVAFVMSYSFTEPREEVSRGGSDGNQSDDSDSEDEEPQMCPPMMVPMADMLNHVTDHNAKLTFGKEALKMVTTRKIDKGEEIFNTYGQVSNLHLMHMYGFSEPYPDNFHDVVEIPVSALLAATKDVLDNAEFVEEKWKFLMDEELLSEDEIIAVGREGIISDEICIEALKVLCKNRAAFDEYKHNGGWSDGESDSSLSGDSKLVFDKIKVLDQKWKRILKRMAEIHASGYPTTLEEDMERMKQSLDDREKYALYLAHGQKHLLQSLVHVCL